MTIVREEDRWNSDNVRLIQKYDMCQSIMLIPSFKCTLGSGNSTLYHRKLALNHYFFKHSWPEAPGRCPTHYVDTFENGFAIERWSSDR